MTELFSLAWHLLKKLVQETSIYRPILYMYFYQNCTDARDRNCAVWLSVCVWTFLVQVSWACVIPIVLGLGFLKRVSPTTTAASTRWVASCERQCTSVSVVILHPCRRRATWAASDSSRLPPTNLQYHCSISLLPSANGLFRFLAPPSGTVFHQTWHLHRRCRYSDSVLKPCPHCHRKRRLIYSRQCGQALGHFSSICHPDLVIWSAILLSTVLWTLR